MQVVFVELLQRSSLNFQFATAPRFFVLSAADNFIVGADSLRLALWERWRHRRRRGLLSAAFGIKSKMLPNLYFSVEISLNIWYNDIVNTGKGENYEAAVQTKILFVVR